ncbi:MAG: leucine-rich repeat domain-containing protein [Candidatus Poribacteria bacterium]|nr:leucine-rich repeat domain-containing protein [Candidatus Poribacteria bacterium]
MRKYLWILIVVLIGWMLSFIGCDKMNKMVKPVLTDKPANVLIYIGRTIWITQADATIEAGTTKRLLASKGIQVEITKNEESVRDWMLQTTADDAVNVLILYGVIPTTIYAVGNIQPDGSVAENWIETPDGDTILNHAGYLGYSSDIDVIGEWTPESKEAVGTNEHGALRNLMDHPFISLFPNSPDVPPYPFMSVTADGEELAPSSVNFVSMRPFPLNQLQGEWFAEKVFASSTGDAQGIFADPVIVRDGNRGRLAIVHQTLGDTPKGAVAAEMISNYLLQDTKVEFPDVNLAKRVREALYLPAEAAIPKVQLTTLTVLDASTQNDAAPEEMIRDITGLEHATRLSELGLSGNKISNIKPLTGLTNLKILGLASNEISNISPLVGLTKLKVLGLTGNEISDISPLSGLTTNLTLLELDFNKISDISPLADMKNLVHLELDSNAIRDVSPLRGLTYLRKLELGSNALSDISPLRDMTNLTELTLYHNTISDISPLRDITNLTELFLHRNVISDISPLRDMTNLTWLSLTNNKISDISPLVGLTNLTWLDLGINAISDISPLAGLTRLRELYLWSNEISDISPLTDMIRLTWLDLIDNEVSDINPLAGLTNLTELALRNNRINDISPLIKLVNLKSLYISGNPNIDKEQLDILLEKNPNLKLDVN